MSLSAKYHIATGVRFFAERFDIAPHRSIARAGLPADFLDEPEELVTGPQYFVMWDGVWEELAREGARKVSPADLAEAVLDAEFDSSVFSFYSSPTMRVGLQRKALLKPLVAPIRLEVSDDGPLVSVTVRSNVPGMDMPTALGWFDLAYFMAVARRAIGPELAAREVEAPQLWDDWDGAADFFGCGITLGDRFRLAFAQEDADLPLVSRDDAQWEQFAQGLQDHFMAAAAAGSTAARVRQALVDGLAGGQAGAEQIARSLGLSKRSLQRRLGEEGLRFKEILEDTRRALALSYLQRSEMSVQEIALLLGFADPSSFFRAFKSWTGQTPQTLRGRR